MVIDDHPIFTHEMKYECLQTQLSLHGEISQLATHGCMHGPALQSSSSSRILVIRMHVLNYCVSCEASVQDSIFHLGYHCPHYMTARQELLDPVLFEIKSFYEHHSLVATDEAQWNA